MPGPSLSRKMTAIPQNLPVTENSNAIALGLQAAGPMIVEALVDPAEYEHLILRAHKLGDKTHKSPHA